MRWRRYQCDIGNFTSRASITLNPTTPGRPSPASGSITEPRRGNRARASPITRRRAVQGIALPVLDAVIESVRDALPDDPVVEAVRGVISPEQIMLGEPIRAADALLVARQLDAAVGEWPPAIA